MANDVKTPGTPPDWVNRLMGLTLRTPLVQRFMGKMFALMTVTGAKTGREYTTPVQYLRHDGELVVLSQTTRKWWRNIAARPEVELRVGGVWMHGHARIASNEEARPVLAACLRAEPRVARFYGLDPDTDGGIDVEGLDHLLERVAVIVVTPQPIEVVSSLST